MSENTNGNDETLSTFDAIMGGSGLHESSYAEAEAALDAHVAKIAEEKSAVTRKGARVTHKQGGPVEVGTVVETLNVTLDGVSMDIAVVWFDTHRHVHPVKVKNLRPLIED